MAEFFLELSTVIIAAVVLGIVFRKLRQPTILAFIVTGILLGSAFFDVISFKGVIQIFSDLGIAFLLFLVGINLDPKVLRDIGKTSIITGIGQISFTSAIGFVLATMLGFGVVESVYIAVALTFSSTIIIVKLLTDKNELNSLYAKISIGFLLVQDFVAILALIFISTFKPEVTLPEQLFSFVFSLAVLALVVWAFSKYLIKRLFDSLAKSQELLFLGGISWCFALASLSMLLGFSKEIGAFLAGISIASLPYSYEVFAKLRYLRDFFIVLFFVYLGSSLVFTSANIVLMPSLLLSVFVLVGNPLIVFVLMTLLGYKGRTSFLSGFTVAQISEFSLILVFLGEKVGHVSKEVTSMVTLVAVITISVSSYLILYNNRIYERMLRRIPILRRPRFLEDTLSNVEEKKYLFAFFGFGETGRRIFSSIKALKEDVLVIDYDPRVIKECIAKGFHCIYGDASDLETVAFVLKRKPHIVVSTVMSRETNERLVREFNRRKRGDQHLIVLAGTIGEAKQLYEKKAEFVLVPSQIAAEKIGVVINDLKSHRNFELDWIKRQYSEGAALA
jgi:Kef-type K+ transport system membrane component KefB